MSDHAERKPLDYAQLKVVDYVERIKPNLTSKEMAALTLVIREAMRDQRHACAEAVNAALSPIAYATVRQRAHQAVMNAEPKEASNGNTY